MWEIRAEAFGRYNFDVFRKLRMSSVFMDRRFPLVPFEAGRFAPFLGTGAGELELELLSGGASNSNYLVRLADGTKCVCRIHSHGDPVLERYVTGLVWDIVPRPEYLWAGNGVSVLSYAEGEMFQPTPALMREAGRIIGRLAKISFKRGGLIFPDGSVQAFKGWSSFADRVEALLEKPAVRAHVDDAMAGEIRDLLTRQREVLADFDGGHNLVHGDFNPCNILVSGDAIVSVLDWEYVHSGCSFMDIGNLMRELSSEWAGELAAGLSEEGFDLPDDWLRRARLMDLSNHVEFLTSQKSHEFKRDCVEKIRMLIAMYGDG